MGVVLGGTVSGDPPKGEEGSIPDMFSRGQHAWAGGVVTGRACGERDRGKETQMSITLESQLRLILLP